MPPLTPGSGSPAFSRTLSSLLKCSRYPSNPLAHEGPRQGHRDQRGLRRARCGPDSLHSLMPGEEPCRMKGEREGQTRTLCLVYTWHLVIRFHPHRTAPPLLPPEMPGEPPGRGPLLRQAGPGSSANFTACPHGFRPPSEAFLPTKLKMDILPHGLGLLHSPFLLPIPQTPSSSNILDSKLVWFVVSLPFQAPGQFFQSALCTDISPRA